MAKSKDKIKISFVGPAADDVTGSCILIKTPDRQILLECGLHQSCKSTLENYKVNNAYFEFKPKEIDYLFVMHNHADHLCLAPKLYAKGCRAQMIMPQGSYEIAEILLRDSANIMQSDAKELSEKFKRDYHPLYIGLLTYGGKMYLNLIRNIEEPLLEAALYGVLRERGVHVKAESNARENGAFTQKFH